MGDDGKEEVGSTAIPARVGEERERVGGVGEGKMREGTQREREGRGESER